MDEFFAKCFFVMVAVLYLIAIRGEMSFTMANGVTLGCIAGTILYESLKWAVRKLLK